MHRKRKTGRVGISVVSLTFNEKDRRLFLLG